MLTGRHWVRDVFCKNCNDKLGWMYEVCYINYMIFFFNFSCFKTFRTKTLKSVCHFFMHGDSFTETISSKYIPFMLFYFPVRPRRKPKIQRVSCHFGKSLDTWKGRFPRRRVYSVISYLNLLGKKSSWSCTLNFWTPAIWRYFSMKEKSWNCRSESIWMRLQKVFEPIVSCNLLP